MTWPPTCDEERRAVLERQRRCLPDLHFIESFRPPPPPEEPVTDAERAKLRRLRDAALAFIETFNPERRR